ncbi:MAG TPA: glycosyltransferase [Acidimicrobiales bacterium]
MGRLVVVSFRLGGTDGVSIEARKWIDAFTTLGHHVTTLAGSGVADVLMPELAIGATSLPSLEAVNDVLRDADVVVVENLVSLPLNVGARDVLYQALDQRAAIFHHHDLAWQRSEWRHEATPRDQALWTHVTINDLSRRELEVRGVSAVTIRNSFDCDPPLGRRDLARATLSITNERLVLLPTRAIPRKNVAGALKLAASLDAVLWLLGPAEDGYGPTLEALLGESNVEVRRGRPEGLTIHDAYAGCDLVAMPSTWEGFGNPVLESVTHRRPLAVYPYRVLEEIRSFGFQFIDLDDLDAVLHFLESPDEELFNRNAALAREHFNLDALPQRLASLLADIESN